jgi:hypothetical protein
VIPQPGKELIARLPRTFAPALNDQFRRWDLLFPAEQRVLKAQLDYFAELRPAEFDQLFAPLVAVERRMELPKWDTAGAGLSIHDAGVIARSPLYPQWRNEVGRVFAQANSAIPPMQLLVGLPRLIVCMLPTGLPLPDARLWTALAPSGRTLPLTAPFARAAAVVLPALAARNRAPGIEPIEANWVIECTPRLAGFLNAAHPVTLSWDAAAPAREAFLARLNRIQRDLHSADQTTAELGRMDLTRLLGDETEPRVREFLRSVMLSGNGSLVFNNSFVQWAGAEALRRAQPQLLVAGFGIRPKLKPFSSTVLFENQQRSNPVADADDPAGSLIDDEMLAAYVHYSAQGLDAYRGYTLTLLACADEARVLVLGPRPALATLPSSATPVEPERLAAILRRWIEARQ